MTEGAPTDKAQRKYEQNVAKALNRVYESDATEEQEIDLDTARIVVFSDHHKGARDGADDFFRCERAYAAALAYYLEQEFRLVCLGDVEELWECTPEEVVKSYGDILRLERNTIAPGSTSASGATTTISGATRKMSRSTSETCSRASVYAKP